MADPPPFPDSPGDTQDDTVVEPGRVPTTSTPLWVKVFGIIALIVIVVFVIALLGGGGGGGDHGPARHTSSGPAGNGTPTSSVAFNIADDQTPPVDGH